MPLEFTGRVFSGKAEAGGFTGLPWARETFIRLVGIDPFPGTLNLRVEDAAARAGWQAAKSGTAIPMPAPRADWCDARLFPVTVAGRERGAVVLPEVADYAPDQIEIIAPVNLRATLGLRDGDEVSIAFSDDVRQEERRP